MAVLIYYTMVIDIVMLLHIDEPKLKRKLNENIVFIKEDKNFIYTETDYERYLSLEEDILKKINEILPNDNFFASTWYRKSHKNDKDLIFQEMNFPSKSDWSVKKVPFNKTEKETIANGINQIISNYNIKNVNILFDNKFRGITLKNFKDNKIKKVRTNQKIKDSCSKYRITDYQIRDDGSIDVDGNVYLRFRLGALKQLPLTFNEVNGYFECGSNNLTTLESCPKVVRSIFNCIFNCSFNKLTSLEHSPKIVEGNFVCEGNDNITSLEGLEDTYIDGALYVDYCKNLYSLKGFPKKVESFNCWGTPIKPIYDTFIQECDYETIRRFNKFDVIYTDGLDWYIDYDNLGKFLRSVSKEDLMMSKEDFDNFIQTTKYRWDY
jgi:hypothetical protein